MTTTGTEQTTDSRTDNDIAMDERHWEHVHADADAVYEQWVMDPQTPSLFLTDEQIHLDKVRDQARDRRYGYAFAYGRLSEAVRQKWSQAELSALVTGLEQGLTTPIGYPTNPSVCAHGYRYENALCPVSYCGASAAT